ncbi:hypothetical protein BDR03DRAFT_1019515, partial [Suillus americanus]
MSRLCACHMFCLNSHSRSPRLGAEYNVVLHFKGARRQSIWLTSTLSSSTLKQILPLSLSLVGGVYTLTLYCWSVCSVDQGRCLLPLHPTVYRWSGVLSTPSLSLLLVGGAVVYSLTLYRLTVCSVGQGRFSIPSVRIVGRGRLSTPSLSIVGRGCLFLTSTLCPPCLTPSPLLPLSLPPLSLTLCLSHHLSKSRNPDCQALYNHSRSQIHANTSEPQLDDELEWPDDDGGYDMEEFEWAREGSGHGSDADEGADDGWDDEADNEPEWEPPVDQQHDH